MPKLLVEKSRTGGRNDRKGRVPRHLEDLPRKQSMKKSHSDRKSLNENLNPLKRFLESKVGSNWDNIFSEICETIKLDTGVQKHVRDHVFDFVRINVKEVEGLLKFSPKYSGKFTELYDGDLYVDPKTNILKKNKIKKVKRSYNPLNDRIKFFFDNDKSKMIIENGMPYRMFFDELTDDYTIKQEATVQHAKLDFKKIGWFSNSNTIVHFLRDYRKQLDLKHPYWNKVVEMVDLHLKSGEKLTQNITKFKVGEVIEFSKDYGKNFIEGIINGIQNKTVYWVTVGTKNISVLFGIDIIRKKF